LFGSLLVKDFLAIDRFPDGSSAAGQYKERKAERERRSFVSSAARKYATSDEGAAFGIDSIIPPGSSGSGFGARER
jgi:hypothetical protein